MAVAAQEKSDVIPFQVIYNQGLDALRSHYEGKLKEQADAHRARVEKEREYVVDLQSRLMHEQDRVARLQKKLLAIRELFSLED
jgi:hypothetical protein